MMSNPPEVKVKKYEYYAIKVISEFDRTFASHRRILSVEEKGLRSPVLVVEGKV